MHNESHYSPSKGRLDFLLLSMEPVVSETIQNITEPDAMYYTIMRKYVGCQEPCLPVQSYYLLFLGIPVYYERYRVPTVKAVLRIRIRTDFGRLDPDMHCEIDADPDQAGQNDLQT
jgi:hypothetical protein